MPSRLTEASQHQLEISSPQLIGRDGEIWLHLIKRDVPNWETKPHEPKDPKNWWKVYKKLKEQTIRDREQGAEKLKAALDSINDEKEQKLAKVLPRKDLPKEPTNHRARTLHNHNSGKTGGKSGHKLSLLEKIRKEAREARLARINVPTSQLVKGSNEVKKAPQGLVDEYKFSARQRSPATVPLLKPPSVPRISRPPLAVARQEKPRNDKPLSEREDRLRALTEGRANRAINSAQTGTVDHTSKASSMTPHPSLPKAKVHLPQSDGTEDEDVDDIPPSDTLPTSKPPGTATASKRQMGTSIPSRFGSPGAPTKRRAEPSIFMSAKKPKVAR